MWPNLLILSIRHVTNSLYLSDKIACVKFQKLLYYRTERQLLSVTFCTKSHETSWKAWLQEHKMLPSLNYWHLASVTACVSGLGQYLSTALKFLNTSSPSFPAMKITNKLTKKGITLRRKAVSVYYIYRRQKKSCIIPFQKMMFS